ncbi:sensor histidine kinase [Homoserinimonas sp. OAct 916]|uniref:sensor histidine kinase n=1 Tax=Homoserinimonas sp. OAct 916 TaxID=2211450 RepID=UPI000DBE73C0|nr:sensor histidine kinase [Homoserinimonas sp. OAct 916]
MKHSALTPVFTTLRIGLHALFVGLVLFVVVRAAIAGGAISTSETWLITGLSVVVILTYLVAAKLPGPTGSARWLVWLGVLLLEWVALMFLTPDAVYLVFPLFFLILHLLPTPWNVIGVFVATALAIAMLAWHNGWSVAIVIGPLIGAAVSVAIGLGYRALYREATERQLLIDDLIATRGQLAATERETGVLAERARLAREIHDTVAQGLSSIQMLLHAVERADEHHPAIEYVRLARETAAHDLAETRRFIAELTPAALEENTLAGALQRLADATARQTGIVVNVRVSGEGTPLPMRIETALLRIAQGSLANVTQHAEASKVELTLSYMEDSVSLDVVDDGRGFDPSAVSQSATGSTHTSFGLQAIRDRVIALGGVVAVESVPGGGTAVAVAFGLEEER